MQTSMPIIIIKNDFIFILFFTQEKNCSMKGSFRKQNASFGTFILNNVDEKRILYSSKYPILCSTEKGSHTANESNWCYRLFWLSAFSLLTNIALPD